MKILLLAFSLSISCFTMGQAVKKETSSSEERIKPKPVNPSPTQPVKQPENQTTTQPRVIKDDEGLFELNLLPATETTIGVTRVRDTEIDQGDPSPELIQYWERKSLEELQKGITLVNPQVGDTPRKPSGSGGKRVIGRGGGSAGIRKDGYKTNIKPTQKNKTSTKGK